MIERREGHGLGRVGARGGGVVRRSGGARRCCRRDRGVGGWGGIGRGRVLGGHDGAAARAAHVSVVRSLLRRDVGVDAIALVSMAGALALGEYLAGAVVALMLAGGNALEERANRRAARELTALVERAPRTALLRRGELVEVAGGGRRARRPCGRPRGRGRPGRRDGRERGGGARRVGAHRRAAAGHDRPRRAGAKRDELRRRGVRAERAASGGREHLRRARAAGRAGRQRASALRSDRRSLRRHLPACHGGGRRPGVGASGRPGASARGLRRRDAVSADPGRADRVHARGFRAALGPASSSRAPRRSSSSARRARCCSTRRVR